MIASAATARRAPDLRWRPLDSVTLGAGPEPIEIFELLHDAPSDSTGATRPPTVRSSG